MSYRGGTRKQAVPGPGGKIAETTTDFLPPLGPGPMVPPSDAVDTGPVINSLGFSIPIPSSRQSKITEGLGDIMSRLNRALGQYGNGFGDDNEADGLSTKDEDARLHKFDIEDEKREFQARYQTITARVDAMERERTELMGSMAEWLESDQEQVSSEPVQGSDKNEALTSDKSLRDELLNTKMGFEKLKQMNHEKERLDSQGRDTGLLQEESSKLQMKVIAKFKKLHETKKLAATRRTFGAHWKHASDEIVGLLRRIRSEGTDEIDSLEDHLERAMNGIQRQAEEMIRLEGRIREKEEMVEKWSAENAKLTNDNLLLNSEKDKCRDIIRKLKKALLEERRKKETPTTPEEVEDIAEGKVTQKLKPGVPQRRDRRGARRVPAGQDAREGPSLCRVCRGRVEPAADAETRPAVPADDRSVTTEHGGTEDGRDGGVLEDVSILKEENDWLTARVASLEQTLIEKETHMMKLEMQLSELLEAVNASSPEIINTLSMTDPVALRGLAPASGNSPPPPTSTGKRQTKTQATADDPIPAEGLKPNTSQKARDARAPKSSSKKGAKKRADEPPTPTVNEPPSQSSLAESTELTELTEQRDKLQGELVAVKGQLMRAQRELITLKYASSGPAAGTVGSAGGGPRQVVREGAAGTGSQQGMAADDGPDGSKIGMPATGISSQGSGTQRQQQQQPQPVVKYDDEFQAYAALMRQGLDGRPSRRMSRPCQKDKAPGGVKASEATAVGPGDRGKSKEAHAGDDRFNMEEFVTYDQGMQTDPQMDPLGQWSNVPSIQKRRRTVDTLPLFSAKDPPVDQAPAERAPIALPPAEWTAFDPTGPVTPAAASNDRPGNVSHQMRLGQEPSKLDAEDIVVYVDRELGRIVQGIKGFTSYLKRLIQREVAHMITANQDIRRHLSEATLRKLDQGDKDSTNPPTDDGRRSRALATPIRRGRFEVVKDNQPSKFATKNAYASLQSGGRRFYHSASPVPHWDMRCKTPTAASYDPSGGWGAFARDHITMADEAAAAARGVPGPHGTVSAHLQHQIELLGQHAIDVLRGTTLFFKDTVTRQLEEYSTLHIAFSLRQELKSLMTPVSAASDNREAGGTNDEERKVLGSDDNTEGGQAQLAHRELPIKLARSTSHSSFLESRNINYLQDRKQVGFDMTRPKDVSMETRSLSSIKSSNRYLPALAVYDSQKPRNRHEMHIPKATLPKRGLVTLQVKAATVTVGPAKGVDSKRQSRPVAVSHRGLLSRQRDLLARVNPRPEGARDQQEQGEEPLTTILELKRQILQLQIDQPPPASDPGPAPPGEGQLQDPDHARALPPLENERRRIIIHAQDQLRVRDPVEKSWHKYVSHLTTETAKM